MAKLCFIVALLTVALFSCQPKENVYKDASAPIEKRVADLLSRMNLEEKILQLNQSAYMNDNPNNQEEIQTKFEPRYGSVIYFSESPKARNMMQKKAMEETRLGIPIIFGYDVIHGYRTVYPISLAQACSWNPQRVEQLCAIAAAETKSAGIDWTFSPMIDVSRDPRWGRVSEGYGEDPLVNGIFGAASVKGYQGDQIPYKIAACLKHYVAYGESEGGRDYAYTDVSDQALWENYLPPYKTGVEAGALTVMSAFNDISGIPASANHYTLTEILRDKWGFQGFVVSDWYSVAQLKAQGYAADDSDATEKALKAGVDMDMMDFLYQNTLDTLVKQGRVDVTVIDEAVKRILRVKFQLGLFDQPYVEEIPDSSRFLLPEYREQARLSAEETMVLLENKGNILPLQQKYKKVAIIGPIAKDKKALLGSWSGKGHAEDVVDIYQGLSDIFPAGTVFSYAKGCDIEKQLPGGFNEALKVAKEADVVILCLGESAGMSGENASRSTISLPAPQEALLEVVSQSKKPVVTLVAAGRPVGLTKIAPLSDALLAIWQPGVEGGHAVANILSGQVNPSARLAVTFPRTEGQIPVYHSMRNRARPYQGMYQDISTDPMYPFGYGLSYANFAYSNLSVSAPEVKGQTPFTVRVEVKNTSETTGRETVLLYMRDKVASISQPYKKFINFQQIELQPNESKIVEFTIKPNPAMAFTNSRGDLVMEEGEFDFMVKDLSTPIRWKK